MKQIEGLPLGSGNYNNPNAAKGGAGFIVTDLTDTAGNTGPDFKIGGEPILLETHVWE